MDKMNELYGKVAKDSVLQAKFAEIMKDAEKAGKEETEKKLVDFSKGAGYDISIEVAQEYFKSFSVKKEGELSDTELDMVAGGKSGDDIANSVLSIGIGC